MMSEREREAGARDGVNLRRVGVRLERGERGERETGGEREGRRRRVRLVLAALQLTWWLLAVTSSNIMTVLSLSPFFSVVIGYKSFPKTKTKLIKRASNRTGKYIPRDGPPENLSHSLYSISYHYLNNRYIIMMRERSRDLLNGAKFVWKTF